MFFFFNDTATTEIYTLSLHDALPICLLIIAHTGPVAARVGGSPQAATLEWTLIRCRRSSPDRKSTRLNSSHLVISYAVFCLKKKHILLVGALHCHGYIRASTITQRRC